jgi:hypothetical protein
VSRSAREGSTPFFATKNKHMKLSKEIKEAIKKEIRKESRKEAQKILELGDDKDRQDFLKYHLKDDGNICCLVLDFAKKKLVESGKMEQKDDDSFNTIIL